jgi:NAD(P)-dependent dehydrogenase (short-subunit alcohol dehydrogenase family)
MRIKLKPICQRIVVVFDTSSGIRRQAASDFARGGPKVVAARGEAGLYPLDEDIYKIKPACRNNCESFAVVADAANFERVKKVADAAVEQFGRLFCRNLYFCTL